MSFAKIDKLSTKNTTKLLWEYSVPAIIGSLVIALYNLIDSIYIGRGPGLGDHAIGGLGVVLPLMTLFSSLSVLIGTGAASRVSIYLGMRKGKAAEQILGNALLLIILLTVLLIILIYCFLPSILNFIGATEETFPFAYEFVLYYLPGSIFFNLTYTLCSIMRSSGFPKKSMYIMLFGVITNILLAPILIFYLEWGMKGAAIATSVSSFITFFPALIHFLNAQNPIRLYLINFRFDLQIAWYTIKIGLSPFVIQLTASFVVFIINNTLKLYGGSMAIEAYTIANRLTLIIILVIVGLTQGMQPIVSYNYGARNMARVFSTIKSAMKAGFSIGLIGFIVGVFGGNLVVLPFNLSDSLADKAINALRLMSLMLPLSGLQMVISNFFQSIDMPLKSTFLSLTRQFLFLIPAVFLLSYSWGLDGIWLAIPLSDLLSTILALIIYLFYIKKFNKIN